ncbi:MAG: SLOG family protein [Bacillota bacterium]|nr:SLOG family protein [Bacillota bacterium]
MDPTVSCCFTGHRTNRLPWQDRETDPRCLALKSRLQAEVEGAYRRGYRHFLCGMAQGADLYFCEAVLALRDRHPEVTIEAAIPFVDQARRWPEADQLRREALLDRCNYETVVQHHYTTGCMARRNRYMVDRSSLLIAVYDGQPHGGTLNTLTYAMRQGVETVILDVE